MILLCEDSAYGRFLSLPLLLMAVFPPMIVPVD